MVTLGHNVGTPLLIYSSLYRFYINYLICIVYELPCYIYRTLYKRHKIVVSYPLIVYYFLSSIFFSALFYNNIIIFKQ